MAAPAARLFFALWPDAAAAAALHAHARALQPACGGRVTRRGALHLTLVFLGAVDRARLAPIEAAAAACRAPGFTLELTETGGWRRTGVVWAAPATVPPALPALVAALEGALAAVGCAFDRRVFTPHVTLLREARPPASAPLLAVAWPVRGFTLVESLREAGGPRYVVRARFALAAP